MARANYGNRLFNLKNRRQDVEILKKAFVTDYTRRLNESYEYLSETDAIKYAIGAMLPVDITYTNNTINEGDRVKKQLEKGLPSNYMVQFKYQGSVTNNTHIKAHSDIDLLTIHGAFVMLEYPMQPTYRYQGDNIQDLVDLRSDSFGVLKSAFPAVTIDNAGAKCISLSGGSLRRKIDVVPSCWLNTVKYVETGLDYYRGVDILDLPNRKLIANTPFLHNKLLEIRDTSTKGNYKKMVRLIKTLKADSDHNIGLSSYDIAGLMYHMSDTEYYVGYSPLKLISNSFQYLIRLYNNDTLRNSLKVPDESRHIFQTGNATKEDLRLIILEINQLLEDIKEDLNKVGSQIDKQILVS